MCARRSQTSCGENHRAVLRLRCACFVGPAAWTLRRAVVAWRARGSGIALACADCGRSLGSKTPQSCAWRTRPAAHTDGCGLRLAHPSSPSPMATGRPATLLVVNTLTSRTRHRAHSWSAPRYRLFDGYAAVAASRIWRCHRGDFPAGVTLALLRLDVGRCPSRLAKRLRPQRHACFPAGGSSANASPGRAPAA